MSKYMVFLGNCSAMSADDIDEVKYFCTLEAVVAMVRVVKAYNAIIFRDNDDGVFKYFCDAAHLNLGAYDG